MAARRGPNLLTVPPGLPFLDSIARAVLAGDLPRRQAGRPDPEDLPRLLILLPTRRACRALQEAFLRAVDGRALLLPRIRPIAGGDEASGVLALAASDPDTALATLAAKPAIGKLERHLVLTSLVLAWSRRRTVAAIEEGAATGDEAAVLAALGRSPAEASGLAQGLAQLIDAVETEGADLAGLAGLVPEELSGQWQQTLDFLALLTEAWPPYLAARGLVSPVAERTRQMEAAGERLLADAVGARVIVAGVTGSIPATVGLMRIVASLPQGAVVLNGLDQSLPEEAWSRIALEAPSHPQYRLARLLAALGVQRSDVHPVPGCVPLRDSIDRFRLVGEMMRPASATAAWHDLAGRLAPDVARRSLAGIARIDAARAEEEANVIALILRRAADGEATSAALVTPDRTLARRVQVRLAAMGIAIDDSAGRPLAKTPPGVLLDLVADVIARRYAPAAVMALLKHPLTRLGLPLAGVRRGARMLELAALRRPYLGDGLEGIARILQDASSGEDEEDLAPTHPAITRMSERDRTLAADVLGRLSDALGPIASLAEGEHPLGSLVDAHVAAAEALARDEEGSTAALWAEEAGEAASLFLSGLLEESGSVLSLPLLEYPELYRSLVQGETVRQTRITHPRLSIWGPFEARLQRPDVVILGGLNDRVWPETAEPDPWLSRPMREALGLPQPETRIGDAAEDFVQHLGASRVYLTRAAKVDGAPTVASRWLLRLDALLAGLGIPDALAGDPTAPWLAWARLRKSEPRLSPRPAPAPRPPVALRPRQLSVTRIETWMASPYAIFAREILRLQALPPLGGGPQGDVRGRIIHQALNRFAEHHPVALPGDIAAALMEEAEAQLERLAAHPRVAAFWRPRLERFAHWFAETEPGRRKGIARSLSEVAGALALVAPAGPFRLTARADRLDIANDGSLIITDYKTGKPPDKKRVLSGTSPQLPLEAAIAIAGGFEGVPAIGVAELRFISASGGHPPGELRTVERDDVAALAARMRAGLERLIGQFDDPATPYRALRRPAFRSSYRFDAYAHLARVGEWSLIEEGDGDE